MEINYQYVLDAEHKSHQLRHVEGLRMEDHWCWVAMKREKSEQVVVENQLLRLKVDVVEQQLHQ